MKFSYIFSIFAYLNCFTFVVAQSDLEVETQTGYEYNYFKSPDAVLVQGNLLEESDVIASSTFQKINIDFEHKIEWESSKLRLIASPNITVFYENLEDSFWDVSLAGKYYYNLSRRTRFLSEVNFKRMNRKGLDGAQDVLVNPLGYTNVGAKTGIEFKLNENNKTKTQGFFNFRNFDEYGQRDLEFREIGINLSTKQSFKINGKKHSIGLFGYYKMRKYKTFNATNIISDGVRDWSYIKIKPFYEFPLTDDLEVKPSFTLYKRFDKIDRSAFTQFGPEISLLYDLRKTELKLYASYLTRDYKSIQARDNDGVIGDTLTYKYLEFSLGLEHKLSKKLFLAVSAYSRIRNTNFTNLEARSFRGYRNQYAGIGLKWKL